VTPRLCQVEFLRADIGEQPDIADADLDLATNLPGIGDRRIVMLQQRVDLRCIKADL
jgi:hypothetical protein